VDSLVNQAGIFAESRFLGAKAPVRLQVYAAVKRRSFTTRRASSLGTIHELMHRSFASLKDDIRVHGILCSRHFLSCSIGMQNARCGPSPEHSREQVRVGQEGFRPFGLGLQLPTRRESSLLG
jgi:hypothetical protein